MSLGNFDVPGSSDSSVEYLPFSAGQNPLNAVFPLTPGSPSSAVQIANALITAEQGVARIDVHPTSAEIAAIATAPISVIPAALVASFMPGKIIAPVSWSMTKTVSAIGALNTVISVEYDDPAWAGFPILPAMNADTNNARAGQYIGFTPTGLTNTNTGVRTGVGKGLRIIGSADPGNFPATLITMKISIVFLIWRI